jgi:hypothetical protein
LVITGVVEKNNSKTHVPFIIYPNPAGNYLKISNQSGETLHSVQFNDITGKEFFQLSDINLVNDDELFIETRPIKARGLIFVVLSTIDQRFYSKLILNDL